MIVYFGLNAALVFIVPFLPHLGRKHKHFFEEDPDDLTPLAICGLIVGKLVGVVRKT